MKYLFIILSLFVFRPAQAQGEEGRRLFYLLMQSAGYDPSATAYFDAIASAGGTLDNTTKTAVNNFVVGMKSNSLWPKFYFIHPLAGTTSVTQKFNLVNPAQYNITWSGTITFDANGATPTTTGLGSTGFSMNGSFALNNYSMGVYSNVNYSGYPVFGSIGNGQTLYTNFSDGKMIAYQVGANLIDFRSTVPNSLGFTLYTSSDFVRNYRNGVLLGTSTTAPTNGTALEVKLWPQSSSTQRVCFDFLAQALTPGEVTTFSTLVNQLMTDLGRNTY